MSAPTLYEIGLLLHLMVNVAIVVSAFWLWRRYKHRFLLLFGFGALLDIFIALAESAASRNPIFDSVHPALAQALIVLFIISSLIFATGWVLLMRHIHKTGFSHRILPSDATRNV